MLNLTSAALFVFTNKRRNRIKLLYFDAILMGKAEPSTEQGDEASAPEGEKSPAARTRRTKAERFPKNIKILVDQITIPDEVLANPDDWDEIGEEHHDELDVIKAEIFWRRTIRKKFVHKTDKAQPPATSLPSTGPSARKSSRPASSRSTKPPSTASAPATAPPAEAASGPVAIPPTAPATSTGIPVAEPSFC